MRCLQRWCRSSAVTESGYCEKHDSLHAATPATASEPHEGFHMAVGDEWWVEERNDSAFLYFAVMDNSLEMERKFAGCLRTIADAHNQSLQPRDTVSEDEWFDDSPAAKKPDSPLVENYLRMFVQDILHGDEIHRAWLLEAVECFIEGKHIPPARSAKPAATPSGGGEWTVEHGALVDPTGYAYEMPTHTAKAVAKAINQSLQPRDK